jgi:hypothetical protein
MALTIESYEDRSGEDTLTENSFGFVYFNDGRRAAYSGPLAAGDPSTVWSPPTSGGGKQEPLTMEHLLMAAKYLHEQGLPKVPLELLS